MTWTAYREAAAKGDKLGSFDAMVSLGMRPVVKRGPLDEPGPRFVDVEGEADKEACRWERGRTKTSDE